MIGALIQGGLLGDPIERTAGNGKPFWTANVRVPAGAEVLFISITTFSETAGVRLMKLSKGAAIAAAGTLESSAWTDREGNERKNWRLTATEVLSVYQARKRRETADSEGSADALD